MRIVWLGLISAVPALSLAAAPAWSHPGHEAGGFAAVGLSHAPAGLEQLLVAVAVSAALWAVARSAPRAEPGAGAA